jgi:hypothetical protein
MGKEYFARTPFWSAPTSASAQADTWREVPKRGQIQSARIFTQPGYFRTHMVGS